MSYTTATSHKVLALIAAFFVTLGVQGSLLAGFEHLAETAQAQDLALCTPSPSTNASAVKNEV